MAKNLTSISEADEAGEASPSISSGPTIAIVGAGLGGIAAACYLKRAGFNDITIFEQSAGAGGTWWDNTYPGAECDIPIAFYSYSFTPYEWKRSHADYREIQQYLEHILREFGLTDRVEYNTRVEDAAWNQDAQAYLVRTDRGTRQFNIFITAVGLLNVPRYPDWPGLESFKGIKFHTARWEHAHDLSDKHVAVVGTGSTAAQVVPALASRVRQISMFSREPAYVVPKDAHDLTDAERDAQKSYWGRRVTRARLFLGVEANVAWRNPKSNAQRAARQAYLDYVDRVFGDRDDLRAHVIPEYPFGCKRPVMSTDLYPSLKRNNVRLVPNAVTAVSKDGVIDSSGEEHKVDVLVMATGFQPWNFLSTLNVTGRGARSLRGVWGEEPEAYLGIQVAGFPNMFIMYGPNTNYFCVTFMLEQQANYIAKSVKRMVRNKASSIEVRRGVMDFYNRRIDRSLSGKVLEANCHNYYHTATGRNVVTFPWRGSLYWLLTRFPGLATKLHRNEDKRKHLDPSRTATPTRSSYQPASQRPWKPP